MTDKDRARFATIIATLGETFDKEPTEALTQAYFATLGEFDIADVAQAGAKILREATFFPKTVDFIQAIQGKPAERALEAWNIAWDAVSSVGAYRGPSFADAAISRTIQAMGGWVAFCRPTEEEQWWRKRFCEIYQSEDGHLGIAPRLIGEHDITNQATGFLTDGGRESA